MYLNEWQNDLLSAKDRARFMSSKSGRMTFI